MTKISPFKAVIYNQEKIKNLARVVCPPYDIISPERQQYYYELDEYNFIRILLTKETPQEDKYRQAASIFKDWLRDEILIQDKEPAFYFYSQQYQFKGEKRIRLGFIGLLHLDDENSSIFGHEHTRLEPKADRLRLLKATKANLSPIFVLFADKKRIINNLYEKYIQDKHPFIELTDEEKIVHKLWKLTVPQILIDIQTKMKNESVFIADGHHRYEVALAYRNEMKKKLKCAITGEENFNYILTYFTNLDAPGLTIMPIHRLVKLKEASDFENLLGQIKEYFRMEEIKDKNKFFFLLHKGGISEHLIGMYKDKKYWLLRLKNIKILDKLIPGKPKEFRALDVSILNYIILSEILGLDLEDRERISFSPYPEELIKSVDSNSLYIAFFLNPLKIKQIISVALSGEKMPAKSTYFYPKVLSGLVINKF
ncbi:MAG: DUF1015 domain-containing protein [Candidatus Omnitrophica bacterium]|nr:DUF1015 domain-containing protein [Candidatus Omnitrophota bacterium]